jgi:hypothetical protein
MSMHKGLETIKLINAYQTKSINVYKNAKTKLMKCCANICFNKQCLKLHVIPKYAQIKFPRSSPTSISTHQKTQIQLCLTLYIILFMITCYFLYCNYQVYREFLITLYNQYYIVLSSTVL